MSWVSLSESRRGERAAFTLYVFELFFSATSACARTIARRSHPISTHALDAVTGRAPVPEPSRCGVRHQTERRGVRDDHDTTPRRRRRARRASARRTRWHRTLVLCIGSPRRQRLRILWLIPPPCRGAARCSSRCLCRLRALRTAPGLPRCRRRSFRPIGPPRRAGPPPLSAWRRSCRH